MPHSPAPRLYDARGNRYLVASPAAVGAPTNDPAQAALTSGSWGPPAIAALPRPPPGSDRHALSDGLLVGPFQATSPFDLLILNTDGTLAERSGNGLTIFATDLAATGIAPAGPFLLRVHHAGGVAPSVRVAAGIRDGLAGFYLDLGTPAIGPDAVAAGPGCLLPAGAAWHAPALAAIDRRWAVSVPVSVGNPHLVTILESPSDLPDMARLRGELLAPLTRIAFARGSGGAGDPCPAGINLQWVAPGPEGTLVARVFERGEGPTESSGTSATAVAMAALSLGLVAGPAVSVVMPGGTAPLTRGADGAMQLFGTARRA
jgi:diaminopimelate epimerase